MNQSTEFDYKKYLYLIEKRKFHFLITALTIMSLAVLLCYVLPKKYEAKSTVFIEKSVIADLVKGIAVAPSIEDKVKVLLYAMNSRTLITKVINDLDMNLKKENAAQMERLITEIQKNTDIKVKDKEGLFIISFTDENPRIARDFVNTLVRRYIEETLSSKREESYGATTFLSDQIATFKSKLDKAEDEVNAFKRDRGSVLSVDPGVLSKEIAEAQQKLEEIAVKKTQLESLRSIAKKNNMPQYRLGELQKKLEELRMEYTDSYPEVIRVKQEIEAAREQLKNRGAEVDRSAVNSQELEKIDIELKALRSSEAYQRNIMNNSRNLLRQIPVSKANLEQLEQERVNQRALYEQLVTRHGQSEVSKQMEVQDKSATFRIIDPAVLPVKPISPDRVKIILMGMVAGLAGGLALVMLLDYLDQSVKTVAFLRTLGLPVLAVIPKMRNPEEVAQKKRKERTYYLIAGVYFSCILMVLAIEAAGAAGIENLFDKIHLREHFSGLKSFLH